MDYGEIEPIIEELKKRTEKTDFSLRIVKGKKPELYDSKFGGVPYWDMKREYPMDSKGNKLMLLAQINFDDFDSEGMLPDAGMLQFFLALDDMFGLNLEMPDTQDTFCVVYHEKVDYSMTEEMVMGLEIPTNLEDGMLEYTPVCNEYAVEISKTKSFMGERDYQFEQTFNSIAQEINIILPKNKSLYDILDDDTYEKMVDELETAGHKMLSYPYFTRTDPRSYQQKYHYYDTLLFQMDSDFLAGEDRVLWGDCGVGNFFINSEDLKRKDFSKVLYNWDCC